MAEADTTSCVTGDLVTGDSVVVTNNGETYTTWPEMASLLGLTRYKSERLPSNGLRGTVVARQGKYIGFRAWNHGMEFVITVDGLSRQANKLSPGATVRVEGTQLSDRNGKLGVLQVFNTGSQRWVVRFYDGEEKHIRPECLTVEAPAAAGSESAPADASIAEAATPQELTKDQVAIIDELLGQTEPSILTDEAIVGKFPPNVRWLVGNHIKDYVKIMLLGNPRKGKSCFGNRMAESQIFESGPSCGTGLTETCARKPIGKKLYIDLPGVRDAKRAKRKQAAKDITQQFNQGGRFQVLFFATELEGGIYPEDQLVIKLVLDAVPQIEKDKYTIIFNRCSGHFMECSRDEKWKIAFQDFFLEPLPRRTRHFLYVPRSEDLVSMKASEVTWNQCPLERLDKERLEKAPTVTIPPGSAKDINADSIEDLLETIDNSMESRQRLEQAKAKIERKLQNPGVNPDLPRNPSGPQVAPSQEDSETQRTRNTILVSIMMGILLIPAFMTIFIPGLFEYAWLVHLGSKTIIVQKFWAGFLLFQLANGIYSVQKALKQQAINDHSDNLAFEVQPYLFPGGFRLPWSWAVTNKDVWLLQRSIHTVNDLLTSRTYCTSNQVPAVVSTCWCLTTMVPFFAVFMALRYNWSMSTVRLLLFGFEDDLQAMLGIIVLFQYTGSTISISTITSCASAWFSIVVGFGELRARLTRTANRDLPPTTRDAGMQGSQMNQPLMP